MTAHPVPDQPAATHYKEPDWFTRNVLNRLLNGLTRLGVSVMGSRVLDTGAAPAASCSTPR